ncbi:hypothetical protein LS73_003855 [Helicobacter muridarum]|uniref:Endoribonuclease YbeY n=1 Tax=Helicobacter muridarum TaxID=216 RepID=A0A377PW85_9HELI|nr:rRNA maturation RNase YbeY [Helicobacter muridarum]TLE00793.1 hypothetical protein LS73_003855 [Helicobacter muridarum]STQ86521.1 putative metalloprotease [Helicobacter muridarum]
MQIDFIDQSNFLQKSDIVNSWARFPKNLQTLIDDKMLGDSIYNDIFKDINLDICYKTYFGIISEYILVNLFHAIFDSNKTNNISLDSIFFAESTDKAYNEFIDETHVRYLQYFISKRDLSIIENVFVEFILVDNMGIRELNREYLQRDYSTDVLSFPLYVMPFCKISHIINSYVISNISMQPITKLSNKQSVIKSLDSKLEVDYQPTQCLGSIVINTQEALNQSDLLGHNVHTEVCILFVHALLHLLGFNHESDFGEQRRIEKIIIESLRLPYGLIERTLDSSKSN